MADTLRPGERLRRRAEFTRVYDAGIRLSGRFMTLIVLPNAVGVARVGAVATRRLGGAVRRNRAKRLVREIFRRNKISRGLDIVVLTRREMLEASFSDLETDYRAILARHRRRQG